MRLAGTLISAFSMTSCMVGPHYQRPAANAPQVFRGATAPDVAPNSTTASLGDEKWAEVYRDPILQQLIREALANNYDVKIAAQHVLEQQDQVGITRAQQFPTVSGGASYTGIGLPSSLTKDLNSGSNGGTLNSSSFYAGGFTLSAAWNLDFWGLYRHQTEACTRAVAGHRVGAPNDNQ
jgi:multidrug efflux system outer membrane protein